KKKLSTLKIKSAGAGQPAQLVATGNQTVVGELRVQRVPAKTSSPDATIPAIRIEAEGSKIIVTYFVPESPMSLRNPLTVHEGPPRQPAAGTSLTKVNVKASKRSKSARSTRDEEASDTDAALAGGESAAKAQTGLGDFVTQLVTAAAAKDFLQLGASPIEDV